MNRVEGSYADFISLWEDRSILARKLLQAYAWTVRTKSFFLYRSREDETETIYESYGNAVTEQEIIDIVQSFSVVKTLKQLVIHDVNDLDAYGHSIERVHHRGKDIEDACLSLRYRHGIVPKVNILGKEHMK